MVGSFIDDRDGWDDSFQAGYKDESQRPADADESDSSISNPESYIDDRYVETETDAHSSVSENHISHLSGGRSGTTFVFTPIPKPPVYVIREKRGHIKILNEHCRSLQRSRPFYGTEEEREKEAEDYAEEVKRAMVKMGVHPQHQKSGESGMKALAAKMWPKKQPRAAAPIVGTEEDDAYQGDTSDGAQLVPSVATKRSGKGKGKDKDQGKNKPAPPVKRDLQPTVEDAHDDWNTAGEAWGPLPQQTDDPFTDTAGLVPTDGSDTSSIDAPIDGLFDNPPTQFEPADKWAAETGLSRYVTAEEPPTMTTVWDDAPAPVSAPATAPTTSKNHASKNAQKLAYVDRPGTPMPEVYKRSGPLAQAPNIRPTDDLASRSPFETASASQHTDPNRNISGSNLVKAKRLPSPKKATPASTTIDTTSKSKNKAKSPGEAKNVSRSTTGYARIPSPPLAPPSLPTRTDSLPARSGSSDSTDNTPNDPSAIAAAQARARGSDRSKASSILGLQDYGIGRDHDSGKSKAKAKGKEETTKRVSELKSVKYEDTIHPHDSISQVGSSRHSYHSRGTHRSIYSHNHSHDRGTNHSARSNPSQSNHSKTGPRSILSSLLSRRSISSIASPSNKDKSKTKTSEGGWEVHGANANANNDDGWGTASAHGGSKDGGSKNGGDAGAWDKGGSGGGW